MLDSSIALAGLLLVQLLVLRRAGLASYQRDDTTPARLVSLARGGVVAYLFVVQLPQLAEESEELGTFLSAENGSAPWFGQLILALAFAAGFVLAQSGARFGNSPLPLRSTSRIAWNLTIGFLVAQPVAQETELLAFACAMALYLLVADRHEEWAEPRNPASCALPGALLLGWTIGAAAGGAVTGALLLSLLSGGTLVTTAGRQLSDTSAPALPFLAAISATAVFLIGMKL